MFDFILLIAWIYTLFELIIYLVALVILIDLYSDGDHDIGKLEEWEDVKNE